MNITPFFIQTASRCRNDQLMHRKHTDAINCFDTLLFNSIVYNTYFKGIVHSTLVSWHAGRTHRSLSNRVEHINSSTRRQTCLATSTEYMNTTKLCQQVVVLLPPRMGLQKNISCNAKWAGAQTWFFATISRAKAQSQYSKTWRCQEIPTLE